MAIQAGVGQSSKKDPFETGFEACKLALEKLGGKKADLVVVFSSVALDPKEVIRGVREASDNALLVGCSDAGSITIAGPAKNSVGVMAISSDKLNFYTGLKEGIKDGAREAGQGVAKEIQENAKEPLKAFLMFPDVLSGNGADIVRGVLDVLGEHFVVLGGAAGDDFLFEKTYQYKDGEVVSGAVAGLGISGDFVMGAGVRHGWMPIGSPMIVTKSKGSVVYELDNKPAIRIYEDYFGEERAKDLKNEPLARLAITYPLGIKVSDLDEYLIRDPITADENGAITCAAEIPEGSEVRLMIGSKEKAIEAAQDAARKLMKDFQEQKAKPKFVLMFNCIAREKLFAQKANDEIQAVMKIIGADVPLLGFYTYGEIAPIKGEVRDTDKIISKFYNETVVMLAIGE
ncbi:FIST C-terminal domain-containing protein [Patescibacteria group bacterium]|nr:FIST C-terminal domain-containing protein [Patescibacteria group bacterium]